MNTDNLRLIIDATEIEAENHNRNAGTGVPLIDPSVSLPTGSLRELLDTLAAKDAKLDFEHHRAECLLMEVRSCTAENAALRKEVEELRMGLDQYKHWFEQADKCANEREVIILTQLRELEALRAAMPKSRCVIYDLTPAQATESAIAAKLIEMGWTPPSPEDSAQGHTTEPGEKS